MNEITLEQILSTCDHTLLKQESTWEQIRNLCDEGIQFHTASVCIPPAFVKQAKEYVGEKLAICTVIGFIPYRKRRPDGRVWAAGPYPQNLSR